jgi:hypothetical protein
VFTVEGRFIGMFNTATAAGERSQPAAVAALGDGNLAVAQWREASCIQRFTKNGDFLGEWIGGGEEPGRVLEPTDLAVGADGSLFVLDRDGERVQRFDATGRFLEIVFDWREVTGHGR